MQSGASDGVWQHGVGWDDFGMSPAGRLSLAILGLVVMSCLATACSGPRSSSIVALGDSVPRGTGCECRPYPPLSADDLAAATHRSVSATNDAVAGATSASVLVQLSSDSAVIDRLRTADALEIEVGANDVSHSQACGTRVDCYASQLPALENNLAAILARAHELTSGHKVSVVLLDYWSVWLGGKYAAEQGTAYVNAAKELTDRVDAMIKATAAETGSHYVDLRAAFKGPDYAYDETHFLASDGDHPNAAGHEQIAKAVEAVLVPGFR